MQCYYWQCYFINPLLYTKSVILTLSKKQMKRNTQTIQSDKNAKQSSMSVLPAIM